MSNFIMKFEQPSKQTVGEITKIVGLARAKFLIPMIDNLNLEANPRSAATGKVTSAIQETIKTTPALFAFKSKGILLAASHYEVLERDRIALSPQNLEIEGILDGGHNTLAIGLFILEKALENTDQSIPKGEIKWNKFKLLWSRNRNLIDQYLEEVRNNDTLPINDTLNFLIPIELIVPRDLENEICMSAFRNELFDICEARNNNAELHVSAKANQKGYFDDFREIMKRRNADIAKNVEWKTNDGGKIKVQDIIALSWIPLNLVENIRDANGKLIGTVTPNKLYNGKGNCLKHFDKFMSSPDVTMQQDEDYRAEIKNIEVLSAFEIAVQLPELYDYIYEKFPELYNANGGKYGRIVAVKALNKARKVRKAPYSGKEISEMSPEGFIMPLAYGLQAIMERVLDVNGEARIVWRTGVDPMIFLTNNLGKIVDRYKEILPLCDYDPQKVGKAVASYSRAIDAYKMAYAGLLE